MRRHFLLSTLGLFLILCGASAVAVDATALWSDAVPRAKDAREFFVAPDGKPANAGTAQAPWDITSALDGSHKFPPGSIVWVKGGVYQHPDRKNAFYAVKLAGTKDAPVIVRAMPGERATIDGGLSVEEPSAHVWLWDLEIVVSEPNRTTTTAGSHPEDLGRPWGGFEVRGGTNAKAISLVIHDCCQGMGVWSSGKETEIYGCIIYNNGWQGPDRHHGHCIYTQNKEGTKTIAACIMSARKDRTGGSSTMHAYGSERAYVDNYLIEDNIAYDEGTFLIGGGRPSHGIVVRRNYLYRCPLRLGYGAENEDCEVRDNVAFGGLEITKFKKVVNEGNVRELPASKCVLIPHRYDPRRAHAAIYNGAKARSVALPVAGFAKPGTRFKLFNPQGGKGERDDATSALGKPVLEGTVEGAAIDVPVVGEFAAFILIAERQ